MSIEISAQDMAAKTGETIDAFAVGKLCRVALPDWSYTTDQRIVSVSYSDLLGDPDDVQLSLSTIPRDLSHTLAGINTDLYGTSTVVGGGGGGGGGGASGKGKLVEYHTAILRNTDSVEMLAWDLNGAKAAITVNANNIALKASQTVVDALTNRVSSAEIDIDGANAAIALKASQTVVDALTNRVSSAEIDIDGANAAIALKASQTVVDALTNRVSSAESSITVNADNIALKVSKNGVISSINQTAESIVISASKINLSGYVTASQLSSAFADFTASTIDSLSVTSLGCTSGVFSSLTANATFRVGTDTFTKHTITVLKSITPASTETVTFLVA